ncbi:MAG: asparagine synthase (glutamine-hydrolyzing) [Phycisphaeraceae bacterium]|nr:asparagine synthase (glutamine-hydrolyzing) [Phycisphaerales bacterium]MCB9859133.1 asparagine synthase (glutamine-hydrolyzing) [Phycisphaeraceae bacterium]
MCGLGCIIRYQKQALLAPDRAIPEAWLSAMDPVLSRRGPDARNVWRTRVTLADGAVLDVAMVHHRLSVIDLTDGAQPMVREGVGDQGTIAVIFNGCIYNHRQLRTELESLGHVFATDHSDTEVLIHGWRQWGRKLPNHLDGMFAFVLWDEKQKTLVAARDLAGEKPLYVWDDPASFDDDHVVVFSSASSALMHCVHAIGDGVAAVDAQDNDARMHAWMEFGFLDHPAEQHTHQVPARSIESWSCSRSGLRHVSQRWRELPTRKPKRSVSFDEVKSKLGALIDTAVESRLEADVPVGCLLSGGIDSALVAHAAQKALRKQGRTLRTFTMRMPDARYDESARAEAVAKALGTDHTTLDVQPNVAQDMIQLIEFLGLPFGDSSLLPTYWVCKAAREHVKVVLTGDGGDELFAGYERHRVSAMLQRWKKLIRFMPASLFPDRDPKSRSSKIRRLIEAARGDGYPDLLRINCVRPKKQDWWPNETIMYNMADPMRADFSVYLPDDLLRKTDTASMFVGLEARCPLLAPEIVELGLSTPVDVLMQGNTTKPILRALARDRLPADVASLIADGPKMGFAIPIGQWFRDDTGGVRTLLESYLARREMFPGVPNSKLNNTLIARWLKEHDAAVKGTGRDFVDSRDWNSALLTRWWQEHNAVGCSKGRDHSQRLYLALAMAIWCDWRERVLSTVPD